MKNILVSQPKPVSIEKTPFHELIEKYKVNVDFAPFIKVEAVTAKDFRAQRIDVLVHTAIIFSSRGNIDTFFSVCEENRITIPDSMKYFCTSETIALYLQKYIVYRKRKIFFGKGSFTDLVDIIMKHKDEKYLLALSDPYSNEVPMALDKAKIQYSKIILSHTVSRAVKEEVDIKKYDMVIVYSSPDVLSLMANFPEVKGDCITVATYGTSTASTADANGIKVSVLASPKTFPSMIIALVDYIEKEKKSIPVDTTYIKEAIEIENAIKEQTLAKVKSSRAKKSSSRTTSSSAKKSVPAK